MRAGANRNPRHIKQFINAYMMASAVTDELTEDEQLSLAKVVMILLRFPEFYRELQEDSKLLERIDGDAAAFEAEPSATEPLRRFLDETKGIDIRPRLIRRWIRVTAVADTMVEDAGDD
jgi:hypothetical protein